VINFVKLERNSDRICHSKETGGKTMKKVARLLGFSLVLAAVLAIGFAGVSEAYTPYQSESVGVSATMGVSDILMLQAKNISDNSDAASVDFGSVSNAVVLAPQYLEIDVGSNRADWELAIYTDNFDGTQSTTTWGTQYGGLKGATDGNLAPMLWQTYDETVASPGPTAVVDDPMPWTWMKDKSDCGDFPWLQAGILDGYANIAFGGPDYTNIITPNGTYTGTEIVEGTSPIAVYLEGNFVPAVADSYSATVGFDLYFEPTP